MLACPWGAGSVHCARQESQAVHNQPRKQRPPASPTSSKAHTQHWPQHGHVEAVSKEHLWRQRIHSTATGAETQQYEFFLLPSKQSPDKSPGTEQPVLFPPLHPSGGGPSKYKSSGAMVPLKSHRT